MRITGVRMITCDIPLPHPIVMGELRFDSREYVLVVIETDAGVRGVGFGMTRAAPVGAIVDRNLAPLLLGQDSLMSELLWQRLYDRNLTIAGQGIFMRALSAVDIALWDIKGQVAGQPIWVLLGGAREQVEVAVAGGYARDGVGLADLASARGRSVLPHVFPEVHIHLAAALPAVRAVEITLPEYELEALHRLFANWIELDGGQAAAPTAPGLGYALDERAVAQYTVNSTHAP